MKKYSKNRQLLEQLGSPKDSNSEPMNWSLLRQVDNYLAYIEQQYPQLKEIDLRLKYNRDIGYIELMTNDWNILNYIQFTKGKTIYSDPDGLYSSVDLDDLAVYDCIDEMVGRLLTIKAKNNENHSI